MIVFMSDLHITDKTTGVQHLSVEAFNQALPNMAKQAADARSKDVTMVFLGDVFDVVRTTFWLDPERERPWDYMPGKTPPPDSKAAANALTLLNTVIRNSQDVFDLWSSPLKGRFGFEVEPKRIYIPGNHDRICNQFPALRQRVIETLGLNIGQDTPLDPNEPFKYYYHHPRYRVFARHGQEWDNFNYEHVEEWRRNDYIIPPDEHYLDIPIGELIAAHVASALPSAVCRKLKGKISYNDLKRIVEHMKTLDDVRPMAAILPWLIDSINTQTAMRAHQGLVLQALTEAVREVIMAFDKLPYTKSWMKKHDGLSFDMVDQLQLAILALQKMKITTLSRILQAAEERPAQALEAILRIMPCLDRALSDDNYATAAHDDVRRISLDPRFQNILYMLYGHTHRADQIPIDTPKDSACQVYLNTGTWRPLYRQTISKVGFIRWLNLNYTIFYNSEDDPYDGAEPYDPTFETWTGTLLDPLKLDPDKLGDPC